MASIDSSIVNVSLPVMRKQFNCDINDIEWVITAYMLAFCIFMPMVNWLKRKIGYYWLYIISLFVFTAGSLLCGFSDSLNMLISARVLQALGGGALTPTAMAILSDVFPKKELGKVLGWWAISGIVGPALGPTLGGILTEYFGWPSIFMINIPIGIIAISIAAVTLRPLRNEKLDLSARFDLRGFSLFTMFILLFQYSIVEMSKTGLSSLKVILPFCLSFLLLYIFVRISWGKLNALFDLQIFEHRLFVNCMLITLVRSVALYGGLFLLPFLLQGLLHYSEIQSGLLILPNSIMMAILTPLAGSWSDKNGPRKIVFTGILLVALSMLMFSQANAAVTWFIILAMTVRGMGMGLLVSPLTSTSLNSVFPYQNAAASSMYSLMQQLGGSIGIALSGLTHRFLSAFYTTRGNTAAVAEHLAIQDVFIVSMLLVLLALIPSFKLPGNGLAHKMVPEPVPMEKL